MEICQQSFEIALEHISDAVLYGRIIQNNGVAVDCEHLYLNTAYARIIGGKKKDVIGSTLKELHSDPGSFAGLISFLGEIASRGNREVLEQYADLGDKWYKIRAFSPETGYFVAIFKELSEPFQSHEELNFHNEELKKINEQIKVQKARLDEKNKILELIMRSSCDRVWYLKRNTGEKELAGRFLNVCSTENITIEEWEHRIHPDDREHVCKLFNEFFNGKTEDYYDEYRVRSEDGSYKWIRSSGRSYSDQNGKPSILAGMHIDINNLKVHEDQLAYIAYHDSLTSLPNRKLFFDRLDITLKKAKRLNEKVAVLFLDIDNFKKINDSMGHDCGDEILRQSAHRISSNIRDYDTLARLGGDEFVLSFQNASCNEEILALTKRVKDCFLKPFVLGKNSVVHLSCSIGISVFPDHGVTKEELLKYADMAMYKAKESGKNTVRIFSFAIAEEVLLKFNMEKGLRKALEKEEFELIYQPQYDIETGRIRGVEALLRWNNPFKGHLEPVDFINVAEETGLIIPIGEWVIKKACETAKKWKSEYDFQGMISVNISATQLRNGDIVKAIKDILSETELSPSSLEIEISENTFADCLDETILKMIELKKMGIKISLDNFGKGYSSLGYLRRLPIHVLKIDKSFVEEINPGYQGKKIVSSIISLAQDLDIDVIAEGIETSEQYDYLKKARCGFIQGHFTSKPISEELIGELIKRDLKEKSFPE
ncbi:GGDEF and EAL domain-containing protein [Syntrophobotulus glycolicus]|uniref:GGDEF and EAL domain-containing protein n=1 Tax=Syntrophobotulus glycolicus TaxID=51197 RepID=UPI0002F6A1F7|nr:GGDEF and EAL domain-containing protein [Syntrophobotulus glycolicus]